MELKDAWNKIKAMENSERFKPNQIHSILADLGVFKTNPRIRLVLKAALIYDLWNIILGEESSPDKTDILKSKLQFNGFSDVVIDEIVSSINNVVNTSNTIDKWSDFVKQDLPGIDVRSNIPSELSFLGIRLGQSIEKCIALLEGKSFNFEKYVRIPKGEHFASLEGKFTYYNYCKVSLYYNRVSRLVYKISIFQNTGLMKERQVNELSNQIYGLYSTKFGQPTCFQRNIDDVLHYAISSKEFIEVKKNAFSLPRIVYINQSMLEEAHVAINRIIEAEKAAETKEQKNLIDKFLNDI